MSLSPSSSSSSSKPLPSSQQIQQSLQHLAYLSTLLDSSSSHPTDAAPPTSDSSRFPGLVDILPHLLAPLTDLTRLQAAKSIQPTDQRIRGPRPLEEGGGGAVIAGKGVSSKIQPSSSLATYRPLTAQVSAILAQLMDSIRDEKGEGGVREAISVAEEVLRSQTNGKRGREGEGEGLTREEKREIILSRRKRRKARGIAAEKETAEAKDTVSSSTSTSSQMPKGLTFDVLAKSFVASDDQDGPQPKKRSSSEEIKTQINRRLDQVRSHCVSFDRSRSEQPAGASSTRPNEISKSKTDKPRIWLAQFLADEQETAKSTKGQNICHGMVRIRLPGVGDGLVWFECQNVEDGWYSNVVEVNLRTQAEIEAGDVLQSTKGISRLHLPSSSPVLREMALNIIRRTSLSASSQDPLLSITRAILHILSLRSLYQSPPPTLEQLSLARQQEEQLKLLTGVEMTTEKESQSKVGIVGWLDTKQKGDDAGDSVGVRWAWCVQEGEKHAAGGQWLAFVG